MKSSDKPIILWLLTGCILIYAMVVIGGITRLTHSGLSMVEWNMIVGSLPPMSEKDWIEPFEKYKKTPEYQVLNTHFTLEEFKSIYWWEYTHRFLGRFIGVVFLIPFIYFLLKRKLSPSLLRKCMLLLALGAFQGFLGWYMVKSGLVKNPYVSHYRLAAHLISAFAVFGYTYWVALDLIYSGDVSSNRSNHSVRKWFYLLFTVTIVQILYGAFVAGLKAGYLFPTFPKMGSEWFPEESIFVSGSLLKDFMEHGVGVQFVHRCLAYLVLLLAIMVWSKTRQEGMNFLQKKAGNSILLIVIIQFLLGIFTLVSGMNITLAILHQTGAFFLFASELFLLNRLRR